MSVKRARKSKNSFDENSEKVSGYVNDRGEIVIGGNLIWTYDFFPISSNTEYTYIGYTITQANYHTIRVAWYDENQTFISRVFVINGGNVANTVISPSTAKYARLSLDYGVSDVMFNEGSTPLPYEPYGTILEPCAVKRYHVSKNVWNEATAVAGGINADGTTNSDPNYIRNTTPIQLASGSVIWTHTDYSVTHWIAAYDEENNLIERVKSNEGINAFEYISPASCAYILPFFGSEERPATDISQIWVTPNAQDSYEPYGTMWEPCAEYVRRNGVWVPQT